MDNVIPPRIILLDRLDDLRARLEKSGVQRTRGLKDAMGPDCQYYRKSMGLFMSKDYEEIEALIRLVSEVLDVVEGKK